MAWVNLPFLTLHILTIAHVQIAYQYWNYILCSPTPATENDTARVGWVNQNSKVAGLNTYQWAETCCKVMQSWVKLQNQVIIL